MIIRNQARQTIHTLDEWLVFTPPAKDEKHWKDGRSAKELAKTWMTKDGAKMPQKLPDLLSSHPDMYGFQAELAIPEYGTKLDDFKGSGSRYDFVGEIAGKRALIAIEAKVDESFGEVASEYVLKILKANSRS